MIETASLTIGELLIKAGKELTDSDTPFLDSEMLLGFLTGATREELLLKRDMEINEEVACRFNALIDRRKTGEPIAYITGKKDFYNSSFKVNSSVLIPRPETEMIVESSLANSDDKKIKVLDLCTGSGCIAISIALERTEWEVTATDISADALALAKENQKNLNAKNVNFIESSLFDKVEGKFDLISANPPYVDIADKKNLPISVVDFEPHIALFERDFGLGIIKKIIKTAPLYLNDGGQLLCEFGIGQKKVIEDELKKSDFKSYSFADDIAGIPRVFRAKV